MQMQLIWLVHTVLPTVCMYNMPSLGQYVQPNGLSFSYDVSVTVVSRKSRDNAADSHCAVSVMSSPEGQVPSVIV